MADSEHKKRKRHSNGREIPSKKVAFRAPLAGAIQVDFHHDELASPVIASAPGLTTCASKFNAYSRPRTKNLANGPPRPQSHQLLLQSSQHPRLDYTASPSPLDDQLSHYLAVYDPASKRMQVFPAHSLKVHSVPRPDEDDIPETPSRSQAQQRVDLGREFGTIRAKRALAGREANAINQKSEAASRKDDLEMAILESVAETADSAAKKAEQEAALLASRPIPKPNMAATKVEEVYSFDTLIPPATARMLQVKELQEKARADVSIDFHHRFPAHRVSAVGKGDDISKLQALRYLQLLLEFHDALDKSGRTGKRVPKKDQLATKLPNWSPALVDTVSKRFSDPSFDLPKRNMDNLYTHMCALALYVDDWITDISDLRLDLRMENSQILQYFRELGVNARRMTKAEQARRGLTNAEAAATRIASLKLPLVFPQPSKRR